MEKPWKQPVLPGLLLERLHREYFFSILNGMQAISYYQKTKKRLYSIPVGKYSLMCHVTLFTFQLCMPTKCNFGHYFSHKEFLKCIKVCYYSRSTFRLNLLILFSYNWLKDQNVWLRIWQSCCFQNQVVNNKNSECKLQKFKCSITCSFQIGSNCSKLYS